MWKPNYIENYTALKTAIPIKHPRDNVVSVVVVTGFVDLLRYRIEVDPGVELVPT